MLKNKLFRRITLLISLIVLLTSTMNTTYGFIVTKTDSIVNTFTPIEAIVNSLLIHKLIEHPYGDQYVIPENISFDFKIDLGARYKNNTIKTTNGNMLADEDGTITVTVKPGEPFAINGIDVGTKLTVTEIQKDGTGFSVKDGAFSKEALVSEDGSLNFEYVNIYSPVSAQPCNVTVGGMKILEGRQWQNGDTFSFLLEQKNSDGDWVALGTKSVTYDAENAAFNQFDFSDVVKNLTFDKIGIYHFRMTEIAGNLENVDYDKSINTFTIKVTDIDMDGKLEINAVSAAQNATVTESDGMYTIDVTFNNAFIPTAVPDEIAVNIVVHKRVQNTGAVSIGPEEFAFVLENTVSNEKVALSTDEEGYALFTLPFNITDAGMTYTYRLFEKNGGILGVTYDTKVYDISVSVFLGEDNKLSATVVMDGETVSTAVARFENIYDTENISSSPTGDNIQIAFWFIMMAASGVLCVILLIIDGRYAYIKH